MCFDCDLDARKVRRGRRRADRRGPCCWGATSSRCVYTGRCRGRPRRRLARGRASRPWPRSLSTRRFPRVAARTSSSAATTRPSSPGCYQGAGRLRDERCGWANLGPCLTRRCSVEGLVASRPSTSPAIAVGLERPAGAGCLGAAGRALHLIDVHDVSGCIGEACVASKVCSAHVCGPLGDVLVVVTSHSVELRALPSLQITKKVDSKLFAPRARRRLLLVNVRAGPAGALRRGRRVRRWSCGAARPRRFRGLGRAGGPQRDGRRRGRVAPGVASYAFCGVRGLAGQRGRVGGARRRRRGAGPAVAPRWPLATVLVSGCCGGGRLPRLLTRMMCMCVTKMIVHE